MLEHDAQRDRARSGAIFTSRVQTILNHQLASRGIEVMSCVSESVEATVGVNGARVVMRQVMHRGTAGCLGSNAAFLPRGALLAVRRADLFVVALIDCSVSIHSRQTETCFWAQLYRSDRRFVFVTEDRDVYSARRRSELGVSCDRGSNARRMLESFTDGVYLLGQSERWQDEMIDLEGRGAVPLFDQPGIDGHTEYCDRVRPFDDLIRDLAEWSLTAGKRAPLRATSAPVSDRRRGLVS